MKKGLKKDPSSGSTRFFADFLFHFAQDSKSHIRRALSRFVSLTSMGSWDLAELRAET